VAGIEKRTKIVHQIMLSQRARRGSFFIPTPAGDLPLYGLKLFRYRKPEAFYVPLSEQRLACFPILWTQEFIPRPPPPAFGRLFFYSKVAKLKQ
jgi:hypothetical protein